MFNFEARREAVARLESSVAGYNAQHQIVLTEATDLHRLRDATSREIIAAAEAYVNELAHSPKEFDKSVSEFKVALDHFDGVVHRFATEGETVRVAGAMGAGAAVGLGAATMAAAPAAAMGIATTFGAASTGTAIAALSGAAQVSAATAWLGGGALAAGGGGMAAGAKVLAVLGGPVGWGLGALALAGTGAWTSHKNAEVAQRATAEAIAVEAKVVALRNAQCEIARLSKLTSSHAAGVRAQLGWLKHHAPTDYTQFSNDAKLELGSLINNIRALAKLLNTQVS